MGKHFDTSALNPALPDVTLTIGGKERHLAFDYAAIALAEKLAGVNLLSGTFEASFSTLGSMLYAALLHDEPKLKLDEVGSWINFVNAPIVYQAVLAAWIGSLPEAKPGEAEAQAAQPNAA